eukprot:1977296-Prymnesium_polylepis.1
MSGAGGGESHAPNPIASPSSGALGRRDFVRPETIPVLSDAGRSCGCHEPGAGRVAKTCLYYYGAIGEARS